MFVSHIEAVILVAQVAALAAAGSAHAAAGSVYVADEGANTVTVIDAASFNMIGSIPVGKGPHNVQVSPDGKWVWVTNNGDAAKATATMSSKEMPKAEHGAMAAAGAVWAVTPLPVQWLPRLRLANTLPMWWWPAMGAPPTSPTATTTPSAW
jgi:YVTN family beta-propeller protein